MKCKSLHWCHCSKEESALNDAVCLYMEDYFFLGGVTEVIQLGDYFDKVRLKHVGNLLIPGYSLGCCLCCAFG